MTGGAKSSDWRGLVSSRGGQDPRSDMVKKGPAKYKICTVKQL